MNPSDMFNVFVDKTMSEKIILKLPKRKFCKDNYGPLLYICQG